MRGKLSKHLEENRKGRCLKQGTNKADYKEMTVSSTTLR